MISIIIASVDQALLTKVKTNISQTIGVEFEVIAINNQERKIGICQLYNEGAAKAKYGVLCFMHEDLLVKTENWGKIVIDTFGGNPNLGLIGIAGSQFKSAAPSSWYCYDNEAPELLNFQLIQRYKYINKENAMLYSNPSESKLVEVATIDGLWFCCTREAICSYSFDEELLKGFHGYDLDFSAGLGQNFKLAVTFDILIEHFSEGNTDRNWFKEILKVHAKWSAKLPMNIADVSETKVFFLEKIGFKGIINRMRAERFTFAETRRMLLKAKKSNVMTIRLFFKLYLHLLKVFLRKRR